MSSTASGAPDLVTAVVCTRNRGDSIVRALESILANTYPRFELIVVDQSTDDRTAAAAAPFLADARLRYIRSDTTGVCVARNIGLAQAHSEVVAFTDDDCEVPADWLEQMAGIFRRHAGVVVAFCSVEAGPHDASKGFIPAYRCRANHRLTSIGEKCRARGMGAGLAVRRASVLAMGGFDRLLGPGGRFPACEDGDIAVRALLMGHEVYETDAVAVIHHGFRTFAEGRALSKRDWVGIGAAYAKPVKSGHWRFIVVPTYELLFQAIGPPLRDVMRLKRPRGLARVSNFLSGFAQGWRTPVDKDTLLFCTADAASPPER